MKNGFFSSSPHSAPDRGPAGVLAKAAPWVFFLLVFLFYTYPMGLSDFWWHMNNGRWIWENMAIPSTDLFSYAYARDDDIRRVVITRAYYLGQVSYYFLYSWFGIWGLLLYKALLLGLPLWILWRLMISHGVDRYLGLVLISPLPFMLYRFDELRPHIFAFIGAILVLYLIELLLRRLRQGRGAGALLWALPLTVLLWANLHRGFIIAWVLLAAFAGVEVMRFLLRRNGLAAPQLRTLVMLSATCVLISLLNPNGVDALLANFVELSGPFMGVIDEYFPLFRYAELYGEGLIFYGPLAVVVFCSLFMLRHWRNLEPAHGLLFLGFAWEGFSTFRFSYFQVVMCLALAAPYIAASSRDMAQRVPVLLHGLLAVALLIMSWGVWQRTALIHGPEEEAYLPRAALGFMQANPVPGKVFNAFEYGGYLGWHLYPRHEIFIDARNLDYRVYQQYGRVVQGRFRQVFDHYGVNTVVFFIRQPVLGKVPALVNALLQDAQWQTVFLDRKSIVLVRAAANPGLPEIDRRRVMEYVNQP